MKTPDRLVIAAPASSSGKTTLALLLCAWARRQGLSPSAYKCGPDFIDTQHLEQASGRPAYNLDEWMTGGPKGLLRSFSLGAANSKLAVIEGVMGLYDGKRDAPFGAFSTASVARALGAPIVLVASARKTGVTLAAQLMGLAKADSKARILGVVLNDCPGQRVFDLIAPAIKKLCGFEALGWLPKIKELELPERHLGLLPPSESGSLQARLNAGLAVAEKTLDFGKLLAAAKKSKPLALPKAPLGALGPKRVRIGIAKDEAFHFYYRENLGLFEQAGAELVPFSPLKDRFLPEGLQGLLLGGGFPESFGEALEKNEFLRREIGAKVLAGMPVWAECGGLMYLCTGLTDLKGRRFAMAGALPAEALMTKSLKGFGYTQAKASLESVAAQKGWTLRGHEFHHSELLWRQAPKSAWSVEKAGKEPQREGFLLKSGLATYFHAHLASKPQSASHFVKSCSGYLDGRKHGKKAPQN